MQLSLQGGSFSDATKDGEGRRVGIVEKILCMGTSVELGKIGGGKLSPMGCAVLGVVLGFPQV